MIAVTRAVSPSLAQCELTHREREPIDVVRVRAEHAHYEGVLRSLGAKVVRAPEEPDLPDAVFVEDTAVVLDEIAVVSRPAAPTRLPEIESIAEVLRAYKIVTRIQPPATLDGGDVLRIGRTLYVGLSSRTNREGAAQLAALVERCGYEVIPVDVSGCLHLKSAVTEIGEHMLLINDRFVRRESFGSMELVDVAPTEPDAANALRIGSIVLYPAHFPETAERLRRAGVEVLSVPCAEIAKAEGGLTCCSLLFSETNLSST